MDLQNETNPELLRTIAHPSVRIKGTEDNFSPVTCTDPECNQNKGTHMHCPFCVKTDLYHDLRILKAHYRVKHVDKGIDFGGLKMLRCCEHCDIVGIIKGEKKFKGAHWHCYKCKNGFNRRDEAFKHYRTHFRHPYTTFQIHIPQEVNGSVVVQERMDDNVNDISTDIRNFTVASVHSADSTVTSNSTMPRKSTSIANGAGKFSSCDSILNMNLSMALSEATGEAQPAIMIIQEECIDSPSEFNKGLSSSQDLLPGLKSKNKEKNAIQKIILELQDQNEKLKMELEKREKALKTEIEQLKSQVQLQAQELQCLRQREQELTSQLAIPIDDKMHHLISSLQLQHTEMLQQHLLQVKKEAYLSAIKGIQNGAIMAMDNGNPSSILAREQQSVVALVLDANAGSGLQALPISTYGPRCSERATIGQALAAPGILAVDSRCTTTASSTDATLSTSSKPSPPVVSQVLLTSLDKAASDQPTTSPLILSSGNAQSFQPLRESGGNPQSVVMAVHPDSTSFLVPNKSILVRETPQPTKAIALSEPAHGTLSGYLTTCGVAVVCADSLPQQEVYADSTTKRAKSGVLPTNLMSNNKQQVATEPVLDAGMPTDKRKSADVSSIIIREKKRKENNITSN